MITEVKRINDPFQSHRKSILRSAE